MKSYHLTKEGIQKLKAEREDLLMQRREATERIKNASDMANAAENSEYTVARDEQEAIEKRIATISAILRSAQLISAGSTKSVTVGSVVDVKDGKKITTFQVVGTVEADPLQGRVSDESPLGVALVGKGVGDWVEVKTPTKTRKYRIVAIK